MEAEITLTIIAFSVAIIFISAGLFIAIKFYIEAKEDNKEMQELLKRAKENETLSRKVASKYFEKYHNNN